MNEINIGYFADGPWAHQAFELLVEDKEVHILFICVRYDTQDSTLKDYAAEYSIDYIKDRNINSDAFFDKVKKYQCDLFVSMSFNQIFKSRIINLPPLKSINCHAGKLPFYRGRNILNWVLINDENEFGITIHFIDDGIDTGDIILQNIYEINDSDNYSTLLQRSYTECAKTLYESIKMIQNENVKVIRQNSIHQIGMYCTQRIEGDEIMDWSKSSRELFNFIRAICKPGPGARTVVNGVEMIINNSEMIADAPRYIGISGAVVRVSVDSFVVKTNDSSIRITDYVYDGKIRMGDRLG